MKATKIKAWAILCSMQEADFSSPFLMAHWDEEAAKLLSKDNKEHECIHKIIPCEITYEI